MDKIPGCLPTIHEFYASVGYYLTLYRLQTNKWCKRGGFKNKAFTKYKMQLIYKMQQQNHAIKTKSLNPIKLYTQQANLHNSCHFLAPSYSLLPHTHAIWANIHSHFASFYGSVLLPLRIPLPLQAKWEGGRVPLRGTISIGWRGRWDVSSSEVAVAVCRPLIPLQTGLEKVLSILVWIYDWDDLAASGFWWIITPFLLLWSALLAYGDLPAPFAASVQLPAPCPPPASPCVAPASSL